MVAQRYYTTLCIAFGSDQRQRFARFIGSGAAGNLPQSRANGCREEYDAIRQGFEATIMPHIDQALLKHVRSVNWLKLMTEGN